MYYSLGPHVDSATGSESEQTSMFPRQNPINNKHATAGRYGGCAFFIHARRYAVKPQAFGPPCFHPSQQTGFVIVVAVWLLSLAPTLFRSLAHARDA